MSRPEQDVAHTNTRPTILVTDDAPEYLMLLGEILSPHYNVRIAGNGASAIELAANAPQPSLILLDVEMPGMDGYEMCLAIKDSLRTRTIPVILLTTLSSPANILQGLKSKADYYLTKPYNSALLLARVQTLLERPPTPPDAPSG